MSAGHKNIVPRWLLGKKMAGLSEMAKGGESGIKKCESQLNGKCQLIVDLGLQTFIMTAIIVMLLGIA